MSEPTTIDADRELATRLCPPPKTDAWIATTTPLIARHREEREKRLVEALRVLSVDPPYNETPTIEGMVNWMQQYAHHTLTKLNYTEDG
jgi:hypothetical protein